MFLSGSPFYKRKDWEWHGELLGYNVIGKNILSIVMSVKSNLSRKLSTYLMGWDNVGQPTDIETVTIEWQPNSVNVPFVTSRELITSLSTKKRLKQRKYVTIGQILESF